MESQAERVLIEQSGVIPVREDVEGYLEVLLVTRSQGPGWTIPKGHIEQDLHAAQSAAKEALEEAGVLGVVHPDPLGAFTYRKNGRHRRVALFAMHVTCVLDAWPEMATRTRQWVPIREARWLVHRHEMGQLIAQLAARLDQTALPTLVAA